MQPVVNKAIEIADQKNPYSASDVNALLARIGELLPAAVSFRTDRYRGEPINENNMVRGVLESEFNTIKIGLYGDDARICRQIQGATGLHRNKIPELVEAMRKLAIINNAGSWLLGKSQIEPMEYANGRLNEQSLPANHYLIETCEYLGEDLPRVSQIQIDHQGHIKAGRRAPRRHYFRFFDAAGQEVAALDGSGFALHARQQIMQMDRDKAMLRLNMYRMKLWAEQMGTDADTLAEIFPILGFLAGGLHMTRLRIGG